MSKNNYFEKIKSITEGTIYWNLNYNMKDIIDVEKDNIKVEIKLREINLSSFIYEVSLISKITNKKRSFAWVFYFEDISYLYLPKNMRKEKNAKVIVCYDEECGELEFDIEKLFDYEESIFKYIYLEITDSIKNIVKRLKKEIEEMTLEPVTIKDFMSRIFNKTHKINSLFHFNADIDNISLSDDLKHVYLKTSYNLGVISIDCWFGPYNDISILGNPEKFRDTQISISYIEEDEYSESKDGTKIQLKDILFENESTSKELECILSNILQRGPIELE